MASCVGTVPTYKCKLSCKILVSHSDDYGDYSKWDVMPHGLVDGYQGLWDLKSKRMWEIQCDAVYVLWIRRVSKMSCCVVS